MARWHPAGAMIKAEWTAADGQEREGSVKKAMRMAPTPVAQGAGRVNIAIYTLTETS